MKVMIIILLVSNYADEVWLLTRPQGFNVFSVTHSVTHSLTHSVTLASTMVNVRTCML